MIDPLIDDIGILQGLLEEALTPLGIEVAREVDEDTADRLPVIVYDTTGSNDDAVANGPGLWDVALTISLIAGTDSGAWEVAKAVDAAVMAWDMPGAGWVPNLGGVIRAEREQKFDGVFEARIYDKDAQQADAVYRLRMRNVI